jgi:hypothetical protein
MRACDRKGELAGAFPLCARLILSHQPPWSNGHRGLAACCVRDCCPRLLSPNRRLALPPSCHQRLRKTSYTTAPPPSQRVCQARPRTTHAHAAAGDHPRAAAAIWQGQGAEKAAGQPAGRVCRGGVWLSRGFICTSLPARSRVEHAVRATAAKSAAGNALCPTHSTTAPGRAAPLDSPPLPCPPRQQVQRERRVTPNDLPDARRFGDVLASFDCRWARYAAARGLRAAAHQPREPCVYKICKRRPTRPGDGGRGVH